MRSPLPLIACLVIACLWAVTGCSNGSDSATVNQHTSASGSPEGGMTSQPLDPAQVHGRQLFVDHCGSCHTLAAAGTVGQIGPNLGNIAITEPTIRMAIRNGGGTHSHGAGGHTGNMPRNLVTGKDAQDVAQFVAANAGGSSAP